MKSLTLIILLLCPFLALRSQVELVKDINNVLNDPNLSGDPYNIVVINTTVFFTATNANGTELWKSDGTATGTVMVKDIQPGLNSSNPQSLTNVNGTLFFSADDGVNGFELWKSDGTEAGTVLVSDINSGSSSSSPLWLTNVNGVLMFTCFNAVSGQELWKSNGTAAGTVLVKDILPGGGYSNPQNLTNVNGVLFFTATDGTSGYQLWKSDGTSAGTILLTNHAIDPWDNGGPQYLTNVNGVLYFSANDGVNGRELWKSSGTVVSTVLVKNIASGTNSSNPQYLANINGTLFFSCDDFINGRELWKSNGTAAGTILVRNIFAGSNSSEPWNIVAIGATAYFAADDGVNGRELWKSDGTTAGTVLVKDINPGSASSDPQSMANIGGTLFFSSNDGIFGAELWKSNGTIAGTTLVKDIYNSTQGSIQSSLVAMGTSFFFKANDGINGSELWKSNGTTAGTIMVKDIYTGGSPSDPGGNIRIGNTIFFYAKDGINGRELWKTDGTQTGTVMVKDICPGSFSGSPNYLTEANGLLYFAANDGINGTELWRSDGTTAGTYMVKDIGLGWMYSPSSLTNVNGVLFFVVEHPSYGVELWKSDGTEPGTVLVKDINPGSLGSSFPGGLVNINGILFFRAFDNNGTELWRSDGTELGTYMVKDIAPGTNSSAPSNLINGNGALYFTANDGVNGIELWKSDGTSSGTQLVKDINPGTNSSSPSNLTYVDGQVFFIANDGISGWELWKSDGTTIGTSLVKDIYPGAISSSIQGITKVNNSIFFSANNGISGRELWKSDGTATGTSLIKDIYPGNYEGVTSLSFQNSFQYANTLFFSAKDGIHGVELWKSDGTECGTVLVSDIYQNSNNSHPSSMVEMNGYIYFVATELVYGTELWKHEHNILPSGINYITSCNSYTWSANGTTYTTGGVYTAVLTNINGCDSTATLNLTINYSNAGSETVTACNSYTWSANGITYMTGGVYTAVLTNMNGCDSTVTLNLTINYSNAGSETVTACNSYTWSANGTTYTTGGIYTAVLTNMNGCDSTTTLNLTINNSNTGSESVTACDSYTWSANGTTYTSSGTFTVVLMNMNGCDSTATLNLTINNSNAGSETVIECDSYTWSANGMTYTTSGTYTAVLTNMNGCDSTATLNLTINYSNAGSETVTACNSYTWSANGTTYMTGGVYTAVLTNMNGCDSTVTLNLTINYSNAGSESITVCDSYTWSANGTTYTTSGTYTAVLTNMNGCDSTATLNLTINNSSSGLESVTACDSYTWSANGTMYTTGGIYTAVLTNMNGCDSTATLNLTINNSNSGSENVTECDSYTWSANGTTYMTGGIYTAVLTNMNGCDSTATLNLTINYSNAGSETVTSCNSYTWSANGTTYTTGGVYTAVLTNMNGCDSTATLNLTINNSNSGSENVTECDSYTWSANGTTYTTSGTYTAVLTNMNGCDSTATLNLTINNSSSGLESVTACDSYTWSANGTTYTTGGVYTAVLTNMNGCDSTATLNLTINNSNAGSETVTECDSYTWSANGTTYTTGGVYTVVLTNMNGCDSTATLNLTINNSSSGLESVTACDSYTWSANGTTYTTGGVYTAVLTNMNGCDSTATLNLTINSVDNTVNVIDDITLEANSSAATSYMWLDCDNNYLAIPGATNQQFTATVNGSYAVQLTENGCTDTSICYTINSVGIDVIKSEKIQIFPNPTNDFVTISFGNLDTQSIQIMDAHGKLIQSIDIVSSEMDIDLSAYEFGVYFFKIQTTNGTTIERVVKQ